MCMGGRPSMRRIIGHMSRVMIFVFVFVLFCGGGLTDYVPLFRDLFVVIEEFKEVDDGVLVSWMEGVNGFVGLCLG